SRGGGMIGRLRICIFAHSWISDWNHGNAHFLRGLAYELDRLGHDVRCYEEVDSWSMTNLLEEGIDRATEAFRNFRKAFPTLDVRFYRNDASLLTFLEEQLREADVVIVHEWNDPKLAEAIVSLKTRYAQERLTDTGIEWRGCLPNMEVPQVYTRSALTVHVRRKFSANGLSGVPTIRVFEALACGTALVCSSWLDTEGLSRGGEDYV